MTPEQRERIEKEATAYAKKEWPLWTGTRQWEDAKKDFAAGYILSASELAAKDKEFKLLQEDCGKMLVEQGKILTDRLSTKDKEIEKLKKEAQDWYEAGSKQAIELNKEIEELKEEIRLGRIEWERLQIERVDQLRALNEAGEKVMQFYHLVKLNDPITGKEKELLEAYNKLKSKLKK